MSPALTISCGSWGAATPQTAEGQEVGVVVRRSTKPRDDTVTDDTRSWTPPPKPQQCVDADRHDFLLPLEDM